MLKLIISLPNIMKQQTPPQQTPPQTTTTHILMTSSSSPVKQRDLLLGLIILIHIQRNPRKLE